MDARQLSCDCDMPAGIYCDWLQDQGWDTDEMRESNEVITTYMLTGHGYGHGNGNEEGGWRGRGDQYGYGYWSGNGYARGYGYGNGSATTGDGQ